MQKCWKVEVTNTSSVVAELGAIIVRLRLASAAGVASLSSL